MRFPDDYTPAFDDVTEIVADMVQSELDRCDPGGWSGTTLPGDSDARLARGEVLVRLHIMPGTILDGVFRYTPVQFEVIAETYATSVKVMAFLESELVDKYGHGGLVARQGGGKSSVRSFEVSETQQQLLFVNPDHRMFEETFMVSTKKRTP